MAELLLMSSPRERSCGPQDPFFTFVVFHFFVIVSAFYYYGQTLEQQIRTIDRQRFAVEAELKQCETARKVMVSEQAKLAELTRQLQAARLKKAHSKIH